MNGVLNSNTRWTVENFLNYFEHTIFGIVVDWYGSLNEDDKNALRMMEILATISKNLCKKVEMEFIGAKLDSEEKVREW